MASNSKKPINSGVKGKRGERQVRDLLIQYDYTARRGRQFSGSPESPDVVSSFEEIHIESKWVESLNLYRAFEQSEKDAGGKIPTVWHRKNRTPWMITLRAEDFLKLVQNKKSEKVPESILPALMGVYRLVQQ
jgi:hypothetical protein